MEIKTVGVIGGGTMGSGIAQVAAQSGYNVILIEKNQKLVKDGIKRIDSFLEQGIKRGKVTTEQKKDILSKIKGSTNFNNLNKSDIVIEAVYEDINIKKQVFQKIDKILKKNQICASNTSCLSLTEIASVMKKPERVIGLHFFNPVPLMKLVEVVKALQTSDETVNNSIEFVKSLKKEPVICRDSPGFIVNRLLAPYLNQVIQSYEDGLATKEDIDTACELGLGYPMGPLKLLDLIGMDVHYHISNAMFDVLKDKKYAPPSLLKNMVIAGYLGRKTKKGFYDY